MEKYKAAGVVLNAAQLDAARAGADDRFTALDLVWDAIEAGYRSASVVRVLADFIVQNHAEEYIAYVDDLRGGEIGW